MNRVLKIADYWYGEETRQRVFEPLLADFDNDVRSNGSILTRVRWWIAIVSTFVMCVPRATFGGLPISLVGEFLARAAGFGALAVAMQWLAAQTTREPIAVPLSFVTTVPFIVLPVVWRIRLSGLPVPQRRSLACAVVAVSAMLAFSLNDAAWYLRLAFALMPVTVSAFGWRMGDPAYFRHSSLTSRMWLLGFLVVNAFNVASFPVSLILDTSFVEFWPNGMMVTAPLGLAMYFSMRKLLHRSHQ